MEALPRGVAVLRAAVVAAVLGWPGAGVAAPAAPDPVALADGALRVEVEPTIEDAEKMPGWIAERHPDLAQRLLDAPGRERYILVELEGNYLDFRLRVEAVRDGEVVGAQGEWVECECSLGELMERVGEGIDAAVERIHESVETETEPEPVPEVEPPTEPPVVDVEHRRISGIGVTGIVVGALGVGGVATGAALVGLGERPHGDYQHLTRDTRPPGVALLVTGGVLLGGGVAMLVVDLVQCGRKHPRCAAEDRGDSRAATVRPWIGARGVGLEGRF